LSMNTKNRFKFRAWDHATSCYMYFDLRDSMGHLPLDIPDEQIQQFVGFLDKGGKDIYEGDILKSVYPLEGRRDGSMVDVVVFNFGGFHLKETWALSDYYDEADRIDLEIVGNIYETPEMLDVDKATKLL